MAENQRGDLVLPPNTFAFVLDGTKGYINTYAGPTKTALSEQDRAMRYNAATDKFESVTLDQAIQPFIYADEGSYIVLRNPAKTQPGGKSEHPITAGNGQNTPDLDFGRTINIRGPVNFAMWPGQIADVIRGHTLRSNQYVLCRVLNSEAAQKNWESQVTETAQTATTDPNTQQPAKHIAKIEAKNAFTNIDLKSLVTGQLLVIRGIDVAFYIPPTGIEVVREQPTNRYVREAVTLERLEYCVLIDEDGNKRIEKGPQVVFPKPTETFVTRETKDEQTNQLITARSFKAYTLSKLQALHLQVIAEYNEDGSPTDPESRKAKSLDQKEPDHKVGDEIVIFGKDMPIYFPRAEHAMLKYGENEVHNSVAIPKGDGRYLMDRLTGEIKLIRGPCMLLPDPRSQVLVRRILPPKHVGLWYPLNAEAMTYNQNLAAISTESDSSGQSYVTDQQLRMRTHTGKSGMARGVVASASMLADLGGLESFDQPLAAPAASPSFGSNLIQRGTSYTPPRSISLEASKYEGAVNISPFVGYAVQVVSKTGERHVVEGPATHLLEYDETLEVVSLSTGKPKTTDKLEKTVYLQVQNNRVSDIVVIETRDMVKVELKLSYRVHFEGPSDKWFRVDNYVKLLCDNIRSRLSNEGKQHDIGEFYGNAIDIVRDGILGTAPAAEKEGKRPGLAFEENGMRVYDVEVLAITITDNMIQKMLTEHSVAAFRDTMSIASAERTLDTTRKVESLTRQIAEEQGETQKEKIFIATETALAEFEATMKKRTAEIQQDAKDRELEMSRQQKQDVAHDAQLARNRRTADQDAEIEKIEQERHAQMLVNETKALVDRLTSLKDGLGNTLLALSSDRTMEVLAQASSATTFLGGKNIPDILGKIFEGTPFAGRITDALAGKITGRDRLIQNGAEAGHGSRQEVH